MALAKGWTSSLSPRASETPMGLSCGYACGMRFVLLSLYAESPTTPVPWVITIHLFWLSNNRLRQWSECKHSGVTNARVGLFLSWGIELYLESSQLSIWWQLDDSFVRFPRCMSPLHQWICFSSRQVVMTSSVWNAQKAELQSQPILSSDFFLHFTDIFFFTICTNSPPRKCTGNEKKILSTLLCPQGYRLSFLHQSVCLPCLIHLSTPG